jgi:hypothetical protein
VEALKRTPEETPSAVTARRPRPWAVLASGAFRKLWVALTLSLLGDFFSYVAIAWLVLQLTGSSLALGAVLMTQALPRAALMLVGGALADRFSPRLTMLASMGLRVACVGPLAILVLAGRVQMWEVYAISVVFGIVDAFFMPAQRAILPSVVADHELEAGNALVNVTQMATMIIGPALAGVTVAALGTGWAFAADAGCFAVGFPFILWLPGAAARAAQGGSAAGGLGGQIMAGFRYAWADVGIRATLVIVAAVDFAANGAIGVGLPTLAHSRFSAGAAGLGALLGAWGVGATAGAAAAGVIRPPRRFGWLIVAACAWIGLGIAVVGLLPVLLPAMVALGFAGIATGVINTYGMSWLQRRTDASMQGRVMSLVMLASMGLVPISYALSGAIAQVNATALFVAGGGLIVAAALATATSRTVRNL